MVPGGLRAARHTAQAEIDHAKKMVKEAMLQPGLQTEKQAAATQIVMLYILTTKEMSAPPEIARAFERLSIEAIPALVEGINYVAAFQIGGC